MVEQPEFFSHWLSATFVGITLWRYIVAIGIVTASLALKKAFEVFVLRWLSGRLDKSRMRYNRIIFDALSGPLRAFLLVFGVQLAVLFLVTGSDVPRDLAEFLNGAMTVAFGFLAIWALYRLVDTVAQFLSDMSKRDTNNVDQLFVPFIGKALRVFVVVMGGLTILSSLRVEIGPFIAGMGIGGIAIGLAAQDTLGNLFGSVALLADPPFKIGDWIIVGDRVNGFVETIGLRSTKIRTWPRTLLTIPNKVLANEIIDNQSSMPKRRVFQKLRIAYCDPEVLERALVDLRKLLTDDEDVHQEYHLVQWTDFGEYYLEVMVYYFTIAIAWRPYLECRERINGSMVKILASYGLSMALPVRSIHFDKEKAPNAPEPDPELMGSGV